MSTPAVNSPDAATRFELNGRPVSLSVSPATRLVDALRDDLGALDVKVGCNAGDCGSCTVLLDGAPVCACLTALGQVEGSRVETLTGLATADPQAQRLQQSFLNHGAAQCGICTPGMMVSATALLRENAQPSEQQVCDALGGVLCRCTGYRKIIDAVMDARSEHPACEGEVGASVIKLDGRVKVDGTDRFGDDVAPRDALVLQLITSPYHHARFTLGDVQGFVATHPGIERVITEADVPGRNAFGVIPPFADQPVFPRDIARFKGEAVAAVIGETSAISALKDSDFPIDWQELPACLTPDDAMADGAAQLHDNRPGNIMCRGLVQCGDADAAIADADVHADFSVETGFIEHAYIEPEAGFARRVGDRLEIHGCTQAPYMDRDDLAAIMALDPEAIRIVPSSTGGGFGSKLDLSFQPFIALAAWLTGRPVRITYTRQHSMRSTTKRHPAQMRVSAGVSFNGRLQGLVFDGIFNTGAYASWGPTVANRVPVHASGPYSVRNYRARSTGVHTHCAPAGAFRGFGVPQAAIAQEALFDELAAKINMDRLEFRLLNALDNGMPTVTGQVFESGVGIRPCLAGLAAHWTQAKAEAATFNDTATRNGSPLRRGIGIASGWYGCGNTSLPNPSTIKSGIRRDGTLWLHQGAVDIGQGANTVIAQIFAQALGVPLSAVNLEGPDTDITPDAGKTSASRQTFVSGNAARLSGEALRAGILRLTNCDAGSTIALGPHEIIVNAGAGERRIALDELPADAAGYVLNAQETYDPPTLPLDENGQGVPYAVFGYAAHLAVLDVDIGLGTVKLQRIVAAHDVGRAINPVLVEGQIHGGVAQGIGMALMEEFIPGRTENLHDYLIPTFGDVPPIDSVIVEVADPHGPYGAKGLGEHVLIPTAPAIINAIHDACGAWITRLPATPDKVLSAIRARGQD
jgi:CO/xanthine dehydrogenase Mo-binding subunit